MFSYHYLIKNKNYDCYLSILISESPAPFFGQPPVEILAASFALETFVKSSKDNHLQLMIDNTTAVSSINHMGTSHSDTCHSLTKKFGNGVYHGVSGSVQQTSQGKRTLLLN